MLLSREVPTHPIRLSGAVARLLAKDGVVVIIRGG
jgi:hypothetical protein